MTTITKQDNLPLGALSSPLALTASLLALALALPGDEAWGATCGIKSFSTWYLNGEEIKNDTRVFCGDGVTPPPTKEDFSILGIGSVAIGTDAKASGRTSTAVGKEAKATGDYSTAVGSNATAEGDASVAIGYGAHTTTTGARSIAAGAGAETWAEGSMVFGHGAKVERGGKNAMAFGTSAKVTNGEGAVAFGANAEASKAGAFAFGNQARTVVEGGIAVGERSVASRDAGTVTGVTGYDILRRGPSNDTSETWQSTHAAHAVGNEAVVTRQVTGVAAGVEPTDGVNVAQLKRAREAIDNIHFYVRANGKTSPVYGDDTVHFVGDRNIHVDLNGQTVSINLDPNLKLESITINNGGPRMDKGGINMANSPITNLADGVAPHDAVNKGQLDDVDDNLRAGVATAVAQANVPQAVNPGANMLGFGVGHFRDQAALALGWSARSDNGRWVWRTDLGVNSDEVVLNNTIGYEF